MNSNITIPMQCLFSNAVTIILSVFLTIPYLTSPSGWAVEFPSAAAISVQSNVHPQCSHRLRKPIKRFLQTAEEVSV